MKDLGNGIHHDEGCRVGRYKAGGQDSRPSRGCQRYEQWNVFLHIGLTIRRLNDGDAFQGPIENYGPLLPHVPCHDVAPALNRWNVMILVERVSKSSS